MRLLLDTHVLLWTLFKPGHLSERVRREVENEANEVYVSVVSPWEVAIKAARGHLNPLRDVEEKIAMQHFEVLPVLWRHTRAVESMPRHHNDPFDRMLVAQAQVDGMTIVTTDREMRDYQVALLPALDSA